MGKVPFNPPISTPGVNAISGFGTFSSRQFSVYSLFRQFKQIIKISREIQF